MIHIVVKLIGLSVFVVKVNEMTIYLCCKAIIKSLWLFIVIYMFYSKLTCLYFMFFFKFPLLLPFRNCFRAWKIMNCGNVIKTFQIIRDHYNVNLLATIVMLSSCWNDIILCFFSMSVSNFKCKLIWKKSKKKNVFKKTDLIKTLYYKLHGL